MSSGSAARSVELGNGALIASVGSNERDRIRSALQLVQSPPKTLNHVADEDLPLIAAFLITDKEDAARLFAVERRWRSACAPDGMLKVPLVRIYASRERGLHVLNRCSGPPCQRLELEGDEVELTHLLDQVAGFVTSGRWSIPQLTITEVFRSSDRVGGHSRFGRALSSAIRALEEQPLFHCLKEVELLLNPISNHDADKLAEAFVGTNPLELRLQMNGSQRLQWQLGRKEWQGSRDGRLWVRAAPGVAAAPIDDEENQRLIEQQELQLSASMRRLREMPLNDDPERTRRMLLLTARLVDEISNATRGSFRGEADDEDIEDLDAEISAILQIAGSVAEALHELEEMFVHT
mmetsp:Transcript_10566/g.37084  ORF Transcript_10566/g.37084 Transcript_10566/m.37084 type:complete len:350 (+) Transcript_10566:85-1134(+)